MRKSNFALRLELSLLQELRERAARGDLTKALAILDKAGRGNPPMPGDELPGSD